MVRTKDGGGAARTVASKAPRKALGGGGASETVTVPRRLQAGKSLLLRSSQGIPIILHPKRRRLKKMKMMRNRKREMNHQKKKDKDKSEDNEEIEEESDTEEKGEKEDIEVPFYPMIFNVS